MKKIILMLMILLMPIACFAQEEAQGVSIDDSFSIDIQNQLIPPPDFHEQDPLQTDQILFLQMVSRPDRNQSISTYYILDPTKGADNLVPKPAFMVAGERYSCRFLTPLFNGWGIARGKLYQDPDYESKPEQLFWLSPINGEKGPVIYSGSAYSEFIFKGALFFFSEEGVHKYDIQTGELKTFPVRLKNYNFISPEKLVAEIDYNDKGLLIELDILTFQAKELAALPEMVVKSTGKEYANRHIRLAGKEGIFLVDNAKNVLWFKPNDRPWIKVVESVPIFKTFGGSASWLPVAYLHDGMFAVAKTHAGLPPKQGDTDAVIEIPQALSVTMLVDGYTGEILKETEPVVYDHNPSLNIPDEWLTQEQLTMRAEYSQEEQQNKKLKAETVMKFGLDEDAVTPPGFMGDNIFRVDKESEIDFGNGKRVGLKQWQFVNFSNDGKYTLIYSEGSKKVKDLSWHIDFGLFRKGEDLVHQFTIKREDMSFHIAQCKWLKVLGPDDDLKELGEKNDQYFLKNPLSGN